MVDNSEEKEDLKFAYEQSIIAYQNHVQRYSTWMNMYAVITGALFVALYTSYSGTNINKFPNDLLFFMISILGWISSLCWSGTVKGHYEWMKSFISIVKYNEKRYFAKYGKDMPFVYSKVMVPQSSCNKKDKYIPGFFSTQKITLAFIVLVTFAWAISLWALDAWIAIGMICITVLLFLLNIKCIWKLLKYPIQYIHSTIYPDEIVSFSAR